MITDEDREQIKKLRNRDNAIPYLDSPDLLAPKPERRGKRHTDRSRNWSLLVAGALLGAFAVNYHKIVRVAANTEATNKALTAIDTRLNTISQQITALEMAREAVAETTSEPETIEANSYRVITDNVNVRAGTSTAYDSIATVQTGDSVIVTAQDELTGWYRTVGKVNTDLSTVEQWPGGQIGYISGKLLEIE